MRRRSPSWKTWLGVAASALALLLGSLAAPLARAEPLGEEAYAAWAVDHAQRLLDAMRLPGEFTLRDLRELAARLDALVAEARATEAPARYRAAHAAYLAGMDAVDRVRTTLEVLVRTREPAPELADALFEAGQRVAAGLHRLRAAGVRFSEAVIALLEMLPEREGAPAPGETRADAANAAAPAGAPASPGSSSAPSRGTAPAPAGYLPDPWSAWGTLAEAPHIVPLVAVVTVPARRHSIVLRLHAPCSIGLRHTCGASTRPGGPRGMQPSR
jgi:hypothetical protein